MAAIGFDDDYYGDDRPDGGLFATAFNWAGALLSVLLIVGLATWGWKLWVRDVTGVPVVRALEGPMRVAPDDPGGLASEYQGLTVNRIAEERTDDSMADRVVLAPQPTVLDEEEDLPMAELAPPPALETLPSLDPVASSDEAVANALTEVPDDAVEMAEMSDPGLEPVVAEDITEDGVAPLLEAAEGTVQEHTPSATDLAVAAALADIGLDTDPEIARDTVAAAPGVPVVTPRPALRPENLQRVSYMPATEGVAGGEIDPVTIPVGTRLVQLGAYGSADVARSEWDRALAQFGDYMVGKERVVQEATTGGRSFWRLRAMGFEDLAEARRFCAVLVADGANCIPVVQE